MGRQIIKKKKIPLEKVLKEKQNFPWDEIDFHTDFNKNAFFDKMVERHELKEMEFPKMKGAQVGRGKKSLKLPEPYKTTLEIETRKQTMVIRVK